MSTSMARSDDYSSRCSGCFKTYGKANLKVCGRCRMVRYCSRECQKAAWPAHKARCETGAAYQDALSQDEEMENLNSDFSQWLDCWRKVIHYTSLVALDIPNHPADRLATHCVFIEVQRRPIYPDVARSFKMIDGKVVSREEVIDKFHSLGYKKEQIDRWRKDIRGDDAIHIIIKFHDQLMRFLWFSLRNSNMSTDAETVAMLAKEWEPMLAAHINDIGPSYDSPR